MNYGTKILAALLAAEAIRPSDSEAGIKAWHGTPHDILGSKEGAFALNKIGTGEGHQSYGWGHYFASKKEVAEHYRKVLSAKQGTKGNLYEVELTPKDEEFLLFDEPLSKQSDYVKEAIEKINSDKSITNPTFEGWLKDTKKRDKPGETLYDLISAQIASSKGKDPFMGDYKGASEHLSNIGVKGIKYKDQLSRGENPESFNYIIFADKDIQIVPNVLKNTQPNGKKLAYGIGTGMGLMSLPYDAQASPDWKRLPQEPRPQGPRGGPTKENWRKKMAEQTALRSSEFDPIEMGTAFLTGGATYLQRVLSVLADLGINSALSQE